MGWLTTGDVDEFLDAAGAFLRLESARNTVMLTVTETFRERGGTTGAGDAPLFGWFGQQGNAGAAFMHTPPFPALLTVMTRETAEALAEELAGRPLAGVNADHETAEAFAAAWSRRTGADVSVHRRMRLFRLAELIPPDPAPEGSPRIAGEADRDLLSRWFGEFAVEINDMGGDEYAAAVDDRLSYGGLTVWEKDGVPVSLVGTTRRVAGMVRIGPVYTPPELRGRGYAGAATAEVSRAALAAGVGEVLLYTDLANPTSNALYQRIGYRPVEDRVVLSFGRG
jgi:RimJ/RimL family protein N-acetyltransferase